MPAALCRWGLCPCCPGVGRCLLDANTYHQTRYPNKTLHVEYAGRGNECGILFIFSLFGEYIQLEYARIHVIYRVNQAEYVIHIRVVAPQEYVNIYSTRRNKTQSLPYSAYRSAEITQTSKSLNLYR